MSRARATTLWLLLLLIVVFAGSAATALAISTNLTTMPPLARLCMSACTALFPAYLGLRVAKMFETKRHVKRLLVAIGVTLAVQLIMSIAALARLDDPAAALAAQKALLFD